MGHRARTWSMCCFPSTSPLLTGEGAIVDRLADKDPQRTCMCLELANDIQVRSRAAQALSRLGGKAPLWLNLWRL
eukprot:4562702-Amphidinium_carterae.1